MQRPISLFKFLASLRLAVFLIVALAVAFGAGTFIESNYGAHAAQVLVYRTKWCGLLLFLLAVNLLTSALERIPWKKKHIGFLTTHLGIILMLMGALITQAFGVEGQVQIREGDTESRMTMPEPILHVMEVDSGRAWVYPFSEHVFPWNGKEALKSKSPSSLQINLLTDYPKSLRHESVSESKEGSPALHASLQGSMATMDAWLFLDSPDKSSVHLGPAALTFSKAKIELPKGKKEISEWGQLKFDFEGGGSIEIPLDPGSAGKAYPLKETPFRITIDRIFKDGTVQGNELVERSDSWQNPAVQLTLEGKGITEHHTVFAKFPEFPTLHGLKPSEARVRIAYETPEFASEGEKNEIRFIFFKLNELPEYQVKHGGGIKEGKIEIGKEVETGWMDFKFVVDSYYAKSQVEESYDPLPNTSEHVEAIASVQVEVVKKNDRKVIWLPEGEMTHFKLENSDYHIVYGLATRPLGFQVELKDFMMDKDPGTDRPASFKSSVMLKDPMKGINEEHLIQMNQPLKYRGFKLYQSAYHVEEGKPDISIFTAAKDPGNPFKYSGAIIMVAGILMLFYTKQFSTLKGSDPKLRSR